MVNQGIMTLSDLFGFILYRLVYCLFWVKPYFETHAILDVSVCCLYFLLLICFHSLVSRSKVCQDLGNVNNECLFENCVWRLEVVGTNHLKVTLIFLFVWQELLSCVSETKIQSNLSINIQNKKVQCISSEQLFVAHSKEQMEEQGSQHQAT